MRPPQHFFPALDFRKPPGRWVLPSLAEGVQGERSVPLAKGTLGAQRTKCTELHFGAKKEVSRWATH